MNCERGIKSWRLLKTDVLEQVYLKRISFNNGASLTSPKMEANSILQAPFKDNFTLLGAEIVKTNFSSIT